MPGPARPSALVITGCAGVGKTRLVTGLAQQLEQHHDRVIHWILLQDCLWQSMGQTATELAAAMWPMHLRNQQGVVLVDDVQVLAGADEAMDTEKRALLVAFGQIVDACVEAGVPVVAIATSSSTLPPALLKAGRLEKEIAMEAPTLAQREQILHSLLKDMMMTHDANDISAVVERWASALASTTAGCVAGDLQRMYVGMRRAFLLGWLTILIAMKRLTCSFVAQLCTSSYPCLGSDARQHGGTRMGRFQRGRAHRRTFSTCTIGCHKTSFSQRPRSKRLGSHSLPKLGELEWVYCCQKASVPNGCASMATLLPLDSIR